MAHLTVECKHGLLRGVEKDSIIGQKYWAFLGIPYAKPPIGKLRFKDPEPPESWSGIREADKEGGSCASMHMFLREFQGSDDCLYLNVYTREVSSNLKPVMVWIHGGGFMVGSGDSNIYGPDFIIEHDIILVTMNYRLGVLGFLHVPECQIGNAGLKDQALALKWVQENISNFGGDPHNVTLFGNSAGSASTHYHMLSPMSKGFFHKAIMQSGTAMNFWASSTTTREKSFHLGKLLGCDTNDADKLVSFLQEVPALELAQIQYKTSSEEDKMSLKIIFPFVPTIEERHERAFISEEPETLMRNGSFIKIPCLIGSSSCEGTLTLKTPQVTPEYLKMADEKFSLHLQYWMGLKEMRSSFETEARKVKEFFFGDKEISEETLSNYSEMQSDLVISYEVDRMSRIFLGDGRVPVYNYLFSYEGKRTHFKKFFGATEIPGASHGDDICYMFPMSLLKFPFEPDQEDGKLIRKLTKILANFAKRSDPNSPDLDMQWPQADREKFGYLEIGRLFTFEEGRPFQRRMEMWDDIYKY